MLSTNQGHLPQHVIWVFIGFVLLLIFSSAAFIYKGWHKKTAVTSYNQCVAAGNPITLANPSRCTADGMTFTDTPE